MKIKKINTKTKPKTLGEQYLFKHFWDVPPLDELRLSKLWRKAAKEYDAAIKRAFLDGMYAERMSESGTDLGFWNARKIAEKYGQRLLGGGGKNPANG